MTAKASVNVREGPATTYPIVKTLQKGETVCAESPIDGWCKVSGLGYISGKYLNGSGVESQSTGSCVDKNVYSKMSRQEAIDKLKEQVSNGKNIREKVVAAAKFLAYNFDGLPYFSQGGHYYDFKGDFTAVMNPLWGKCRKLATTTGRQIVGDFYPYGLDCSGYVSWAVFQGYKKDINVANGWGTKGKKIDIKNYKDSRVKVGDLVWRNKHIGIIIEKQGDDYVLAEEGGSRTGLNHSMISKNSSKFTHIVLMDDYYGTTSESSTETTETATETSTENTAENTETTETTVETSTKEEEPQAKEKKVNDIETQFKQIKNYKKIKVSSKTFEEWTGKKPNWVVVHYTGSRNTSAEENAEYMVKKSATVSTHFFCDENGVYRFVDEDHPAWHVGTGVADKVYLEERYALAKENNKKWKKEGAKFKGDLYSFGVDLCTVKATKPKNKKRAVFDEDWDFLPETIVNGAKTVAYLCKKYDIPINHVIRHADAVGKACPRPFVSLSTDKDPHKNDKRWEDFKALVQEYL